MAVTFTPYNHTAKLLLNKEITFSTLRVVLVNQAVVTGFDAAHTTKAQVLGVGGGAEVSGNGWTAGGETIANVAVTQVTTNDAKLDGDDVIVTATGGAIGPAYGALVYDDTHASDAPLVFINFDGVQTAGVTTNFRITWNANGIITVTVT
jgi:hypothetical protein